MTGGTATMSLEQSQPGALDRWATLVALAIACTIFLTVGWFALEPDDPRGAVSLLGRSGFLVMLLEAGGLACVVGALSTLIAGRGSPDVGVLAPALGLLAVSLRGGTVETVLVSHADGSVPFEHGLAVRFGLEAVGWFAVIMAAMLVSAILARWCAVGGEESQPDCSPSPGGVQPVAAPFELLSLFGRFARGNSGQRVIPADGIRHTLFVAAIGLAAMAVLSAGLTFRSVQHGQTCFVVAASVAMATYAAQRFAPVRSALWGVLAVGLMLLVAYGWSAVRPLDATLPPSVPSSHFMRIMPLQFVSVGVAAALLAFSYVYEPFECEADRSASSGQSHRRGVRG